PRTGGPATVPVDGWHDAALGSRTGAAGAARPRATPVVAARRGAGAGTRRTGDLGVVPTSGPQHRDTPARRPAPADRGHRHRGRCGRSNRVAAHTPGMMN